MRICSSEYLFLHSDDVQSIDATRSQFLETVCDLLYDDLRPRILHEPRLTVLCEVCTVLQALMILDASAATPSSALFAETGNPDDSEASDDESNANNERADELSLDLASSRKVNKGNKVGKRLHISHLLKMVLQDAQTRLFFKAQAVIQSEIRHYVPKPEDLKWPDILTGTFCFACPPATLLKIYHLQLRASSRGLRSGKKRALVRYSPMWQHSSTKKPGIRHCA